LKLQVTAAATLRQQNVNYGLAQSLISPLKLSQFTT